MSSHSFLLSLLSSHAVTSAQKNTLQNIRQQIDNLLFSVYGSSIRIYYAGSYGKHTMIKDSFDLDIVIYFPHTESATLKEIYNHVWRTLVKAGYTVQAKNVALRLPYQGGFHVDVVPGRAQDSTFYMATLYENDFDSTMQTSIKMHIDSVQKDTGTIRLMKLWRYHNSINWETFALEQTVIRAMSGMDRSDYEKNLLNVFRFIRDNISTIRLLDPANSANEISMSSVTRSNLRSAALASLAAPTWSSILGSS